MEHIRIKYSVKLAINPSLEIPIYIGEVDDEIIDITRRAFKCQDDMASLGIFDEIILDRKSLIVGDIVCMRIWLMLGHDLHPDFLKLFLGSFYVWGRDSNLEEFPIKRLCVWQGIEGRIIEMFSTLMDSTESTLWLNLTLFFESWQNRFKKGRLEILRCKNCDGGFSSRFCSDCGVEYVCPQCIICPSCVYRHLFSVYDNFWTDVLEKAQFKRFIKREATQIILIWEHCESPLQLFPKDIIGVVARMLALRMPMGLR